MSISFYHIVHLLGILSMISALSVLLLQSEKSKLATIIYGISTLVVFIAGFGMLAKLGYSMMSVWVIGKLLIWAVLAFSVPYVVKRLIHMKRMMFFLSMGLAFVAIILAVLKPY